MSQMRLNKAIASSGLCSRRKADELIAAGEVRVNAQVVTALGTQIDPLQDEITVSGKTLDGIAPDRQQHIYLALYKPPGYLSTARDPQGRKIVLDLLPEAIKIHRPVPAGRLDADSEGLLLLTNDGQMIYRLTHPSQGIQKTYQVLVQGDLTRERLDIMRRGMTLKEGEHLAPVQVALSRRQGRRTWLRMDLKQGVNRQIRRMCRDLGLDVIRLIRIQEGPIGLEGLSRGGYRVLTPSEIQKLKSS